MEGLEFDQIGELERRFEKDEIASMVRDVLAGE